MENHFKNIVFANFILYIIWFFFPLFETSLNQEELDALGWSGYGAKIQSNFFIDYGLFFLYCFTSVGLLYFKKWAKYTFLVLISVSIFTSLLSGIVVCLPFDGTIGYLVTLTDGAICCMLLYTPVRTSFN